MGLSKTDLIVLQSRPMHEAQLQGDLPDWTSLKSNLQMHNDWRAPPFLLLPKKWMLRLVKAVMVSAVH